MKCPACGFDSPEGAQWCDFCKEPFRRKPEPAPAAPPAPAPGAAPAVPASPPPPKANGAESSSPIPEEFSHLDPGERMPVVPPYLRYAAWLFLALWLAAAILVVGYWTGKSVKDPAPAAKPGDQLIVQ